jgi:hypothetical protein
LRAGWKKAAEGIEPAQIVGALNKADTHLVRVALVLAESDADGPGGGGEISGDTLDRAAAIVSYTLDCWRALPSGSGLGLSRRDTTLDDAVEVMREWIESHGGSATRRELQSAHVAGARSNHELDELIARYGDTYPGTVTEHLRPRGGRATVIVAAPQRQPPSLGRCSHGYNAPKRVGKPGEQTQSPDVATNLTEGGYIDAEEPSGDE